MLTRFPRWIAVVVALVAAIVIATQAVGNPTKQVRVDPAAAATAPGFTDLDQLTYAQAKVRLEELSTITLPSDLPGLRAVELSSARLGSDDGARTLTLAGAGTLPLVDGPVELSVVATWPDAGSTEPELSFAVETGELELSALTFSSARLVASETGVAFDGEVAVDGRIADALAYTGHSGAVHFEGTLGGSAAVLFGGGALDSMRLAATLGKAPNAPAWLADRTSTYAFSTEDGLTIDEDLTVTVDGHTNRFTGHVAVPPTGAIEAEFALAGAFDPPYGLPGDELSDIVLRLTPDEAALAFDLDGIAVSAKLGRSGAQLDVEGSLTVPRLVALGASVFGTSPASVPGADAVALEHVSLSLAPNRISAMAEATVRGQRFDALLTLRGSQPLLSLRLPDPVLLSAIVPAAGGTLGGLEVPAMTLTATSLSELTPEEMTPQEAAYFGAETVTFRPGLNLTTKVAPEALGFPAGPEVELAGTLGVGLDSLASSPAGLRLEATMPVPANLLPDWVVPSGPATFAFTYGKGGVAASFATSAGVTVAGRTFDTTIAGRVARDGQRTKIEFKGALGALSQPYGVSWLDAVDSAEVELKTEFGGTQPSTVEASVTGSATLAGRRFDVELGLSRDTSTRARVTARFRGSVALQDIAGAFPRVSDASGRIADITVRDVAASVNVGAGQSTFELTAATSVEDVDATLLVAVRPTDFTLGIKASGEIDLDQLVPDAPAVTLTDSALVLGSATDVRAVSSLSDGEFDFYKTLYGCEASASRTECRTFTQLSLTPGLRLLAGIELDATTQEMAQAIGIQTANAMVEGTIPVLGGHDFALRASLGDLRFAEQPEWFDGGRVSLELGTEGLGFAGDLRVKLARPGGGFDRLDFGVKAKVGFTTPSLTLTGTLKGEDGGVWENAFGLEWLDIRRVALQLGVTFTTGPELTMGFMGDIRVGDTHDLAAALKIGLAPAPPPAFVRPNLIGVSVASMAGVSLDDLLSLGEQITGTELDAEALPEVSLRDLHLQYALETDTDLCLTRGLRFNAELWVGDDLPAPAEERVDANGCRVLDPDPATANSCHDARSEGCMASVYGRFDSSGLVARGELNAFELGPVRFADSSLNLALTPSQQQLRVKGGVRIGSDDYEFASGRADLDLSKEHLAFKGDASLFNRAFHGYLEANAPLDLTSPQFEVRAWLKADARAAMAELIGAEGEKLRPGIIAVGKAIDALLDGGSVYELEQLPTTLRGLGATVPVPVEKMVATVADIQRTIDRYDYRAQPLNLNLALRGLSFSYGGLWVPWIEDTCIGVEIDDVCVGYYSDRTCIGFVRDGGCWIIPPVRVNTPGLCDALNIPASSADCSWNGLVRRYVLPELERAFKSITGVPLSADGIVELADRFADGATSIVNLDCAYFHANASELAQGKVDVELAAKARFLGRPLEFGIGWDFGVRGDGPKEVLLSLLRSALSTSDVTCPTAPVDLDAERVPVPEPEPNVVPAITALTAEPASIDEGGAVTIRGEFTDTGATSRHSVRVDWGDGSQPERFDVPVGKRSFTSTHRYRNDVAARVKVIVADEYGADASRAVSVRVADVAPSDIVLRTVGRLTPEGQVDGKEVYEGTPAIFTIEYQDPGELDGHEVRVNWGDGTPEQTLAAPAGSDGVQVAHVYEREGAFRPTVTVSDVRGARTDSEHSVKVSNSAPVLELAELNPNKTPGTARLRGTIVDAGTDDVHTVTIDWGTAVPAAERKVKQVIKLAPGQRTLDVSRPGAIVGQHTVTIDVDDGQEGGRTRVSSPLTVAP